LKEKSEQVPELTDEDLEGFIEENKRVVIDLWATWCNPCIRMNPIIEGLAEKYDGDVRFAKVDIEKNGATPSKFGIQSIPSFLFFKNGELMAKERGTFNEEEFEETLKRHFEI